MCTVMAGILLIILGVTGMGTAVKFIPQPVVIGFRRHRGAHPSTQIKDSSVCGSRRFRALFGDGLRHWPGFPDSSAKAAVLALCTVVVMVRMPAPYQPHSGGDSGYAGSHSGCVFLEAPCRNHWHAIWRDSQRFAALHHSALSNRSDSRPVGQHYCRDARGDRIAYVGGSIGPHER